MAKNPWREPKSLILWVMLALVLWLIIPFTAQMGRNVFAWTNPGVDVGYRPDALPPDMWHGLVGLLVGLGIVILVCHRLKLGYWWLVAAVLACGPLFLFLPSLGQAGFVLAALLAPVIGALIFTPKPRS